MKFEWSSVRPYEKVEGDWLLLVRCTPEGLIEKFKNQTARMKMFVGRPGDWQRHPGAKQLSPRDPSIAELDDMFYAARHFPEY